MNEFSNILFEFKTKHSLEKYKDIIKDYMLREREKLNGILDKYDLNKYARSILERTDYNITIIIDTIKPNLNNEGILLGSLLLDTKNNRARIFILAKDINTLYSKNNVRKELPYFELLRTLIHELAHLYIDDEQKNREFTRELITKLDVISYINDNFSDLLYLRQVGLKRLKAMRNVGINSLGDIKEENREILRNLPGSSDWHVNKWLEQAKIIKEGRIVYRKIPKIETILNNKILIFDIETNYLRNRILVISVYNSLNSKLKQFFDKDNEEKILKDFLKYIKIYPEHILVSFSNNNFDEIQVKKRLYANNLGEINHRCFDLGLYIQDIIIWRLSSSDYNLKALAGFFGFKYNTNLSGTDVGIMFDKYLKYRTECDWGKIKLYNQEDVMALKLILNNIIEECAKLPTFIEPKIEKARIIRNNDSKINEFSRRFFKLKEIGINSDLLYLEQVGVNRLNSMKQTGINNLKDIKEENREILRNLPGSSDWHVNKWLEQAKIIAKLTSKKRIK